MEAQTWKQRWIRYVFSPQVLLGGVITFLATTGWDYYKEYRSENAKVLAEVRTAIAPYIVPPPTTAASAVRSIDALKQIAALHENQRAKDLVNARVAHLYWIRDSLQKVAQDERDADERKRISEEEARKLVQARRALADAEARKQAEAEDQLRRQEAAAAAAKNAAEAAAARAAVQRIDAKLAQRALDRAPK